MELNADLHIHSRFAMATSPALSPETILAGCRRKGIDVIATGDALHPTWRSMWQEHLFDDSQIVVIPEAEVEDSARVHHVILAESLEQFEALQEAFTPCCTHLTTAGRPHIYADGETIARIAHENGCLIGP
ncbi:MAG: endonuclease Q family protein, partial [Methanocorpusculum sp.]|nr:endonuclease Q family protein [Methanocorpusculum sp.]